MTHSRMWLCAIALSLGAIGCGHGNDTNTTQGATATSGASDVNGGAAMTLRGCVEEGTPGGTYVLRTAPPAEGTRGEARGTSGETSNGSDANGAPARRAEATYRLIPTGSLDLGENLGREVTVTGEMATEAQEGATNTRGPDSTPGKRKEVGARFFRVTSMTKVAENCGPADGGK